MHVKTRAKQSTYEYVRRMIYGIVPSCRHDALSMSVEAHVPNTRNKWEEGEKKV
jgi:hypothetical protein